MTTTLSSLDRDTISPRALSLQVAVLIPCYNEASTITEVVRGFKNALPSATIYVYDNNSTDETKARAAQAGAIVRSERHQGKGRVVRRMFADVDADIYIMVDGDGTYDPSAAVDAITEMTIDRLDLINIARRTSSFTAYRPGHRLGNSLLTNLVAIIFGREFTDMLSGFKLFSRRFVKSFPALSAGFEIETELTIHALELTMPVSEREAPYRDRPVGSMSKLNTFKDGARILRTIARLLKHTRPLAFFGTIGLSFILVAIALGIPLVQTYMATGLVPRFPTALLAVGLVLMGVQGIMAGLILDTVSTIRREAKRMTYMQIQPAGLIRIPRPDIQTVPEFLMTGTCDER